MTSPDPEWIREALQALPEAPPPDAAQKEAFRQEFLERAGQIPASPVSAAPSLRHNGWKQTHWVPKTIQSKLTLRRNRMLALIAAMLLIVSAIGGTTYAVDQAAPGDRLYGLDLAVEKLQLDLATNPQSKAELNLAFAQERLEEARGRLEEGDVENMETALDEYGATIAALAQLVGSAEGADPEALADLLLAAFAIHVTRLEALREELPEQAQAGIERALEASQNGRATALEALGRRGQPANSGRPELEELPAELPVDIPADPPVDVPAGPPADVPAGPPVDVPAGPPADVPAGPPADVPAGPPAKLPAGPPVDVPVGPPADVPVGPPDELPPAPPVDVPVAPPADMPPAPPADIPAEPPVVSPDDPPSGPPETTPVPPPVQPPGGRP
jgi:hypothetical protein